MKFERENTIRFKEMVLLLSFLILLFSFSNKSFGLSKNTEEQKPNAVSVVKETKAIVSGNIKLNLSFKKLISLSNELQINFVDFISKKDSKKFIAQIKNTLFIKPQSTSRLYYLYFSLSDEDLPPLA